LCSQYKMIDRLREQTSKHKSDKIIITTTETKIKETGEEGEELSNENTNDYIKKN
jgi:hypothetical protein